MVLVTWRRLVVAALLLIACTPLASAGSFTVAGPRTFVRASGEPIVEAVDFAAPATRYVLHIESDGVASAIITINGATVVATSAFNNNVRTIDRPVTLRATNRLTVEVRGAPGGTLRIWIEGTDDGPPQIAAAAAPAANAAGWNNTDVVVTFTCSDAISGVAVCPAPIAVSAEGARQVISGEAVDRAGNRAQASVTLNIDKTAPAVVPALSPAPNAQGWNNTNVTVSFGCTDALSGVASCTPPRQVTNEGANQTVGGEATDVAGNPASASATVNLDKTAPAIVATLSAAPNANGWHAAPVTVTFSCEDSGSGVAACPAPVTVSGDGAAQIVRGIARDRAGNSAETSVAINLDQAPPRITAALSEPADAAGWHRRDVTVTFTCGDDLSGVVDCPGPRLVSAEAAGQQISASVTDRSGHTATATVTVNLDKTAPTIAGRVEPPANAEGWHRTPVVVSFTCADGGSGIASCTQPVTVSTEGGGQRVAGLARDQAGNEAASEVVMNVDLTPPGIRAIPSSGGVTNTDVTVEFVCEDAGSGVAVCPAPVVLSTEGLNQIVEGTATDRAGNSSRATVSVSIDKTSPTITATAFPAANADGWHQAPAVTVSFTCDDTGSGVAACPEPVQVTGEGAAQAVSGTATDRAGNSATVTLAVSIDRTPPGIVAQPSTTDWTNADASVHFVCTDTLSGVAFCTDTIGVQTDGIHDITGAAVDRAGNRATASATVRVDKTAPTIAATPDRAPNGAGWYNAPVTVTFACADGGSGVADCPAPSTVGGDGPNQAVSGTVADRAGNTATASLHVSVDTTPPTIQAVVGSGWSAADTIVSFECADAGGSGVASCPAQIVVSAEGATLVRGTATDLAGNSATVEATVQIDRTPPAITASASRPANAQGWYNQPVRVEFQCADSVSSVASCPAPVDVTADGAGQAIAGTAVDAAGNSATATLTINMDATPPTAVARLTPAAPWSNGPVTVAFECADALSGVASCPAPQSLSSEGANQPVSGEVVDVAGNRGVASAVVNIDVTPPAVTPVVTPAANAAGWHREIATVTFQCSDILSGIVECPDPVSVSTDGANQEVAGTARDAAGNTAAASAAVSLDRAAPVLAITSPAPNAVLPVASALIAGTVQDGVSGIASVTCGAVAAAVSTGSFTCTVPLTPGANSVAISATDRAGNASAVQLPLIYTANANPVARPGGPYSGETGRAVSMSGAESSDPEGQALTYTWTFGDGATATGPSVTHTYQSAGVFSVELTVRDTEGGTSTASTTATIATANRAPVADAGGPYTGDAAQTLTLSASGSTDPDGDALTYSWSLGDGSSAAGAVVRRAYSTPGVYSATVTVTDSRGATATDTAQVTVRAINQRPVASVGGPYSGEVGRPIAFNGSGSSDPDQDTLTYAWTFGDGGSATGVSPTHTFGSAGSFSVTLTVTDGRGGSQSASTQVPITVPNQAPVARIDGPAEARVGDPLAYSASASTDADNDLLTFAWSFGDGRSSTGPNVTHAFSQPGTYTVSVIVNDGRGASATATLTVTVAAAPQENRPPVAHAGGPYAGEANLPVIFDASQSADPDSEALTYAWDFGDGESGSGASPSHVYVEPRQYTVSLTVTDARGATATGTTSVTVIPQADRAPPIVSLLAPREVLPGSQVTVRAQATDNVGVTSVTFEVSGQADAPLPAAPFERQVQVPNVAAPGTRIPVRAVARDAAGNSGAAEGALIIAAQPDNVPPGITLQLPAQAAPGTTVRFSATAQDNDGVASVAFTAGAAPLLTDADAPFEAASAVPADAAPGSSIQFSAQARDYTGNQATATGVVTIVDAPDTTAPSVQVTAPATVPPGGTIAVSATASDAGGIAAVVFTVDTALLATLTSPPYQATYQIPASAVPGTTFRIEARAVDFAGLESSAVQLTQLVVPVSSDGFVVGEVYDDSTGLPLGGAVVTVRRTDGSGQPQTFAADHRGRFAFPSEPGLVHVRIQRDGYTMADRIAAVTGRAATELPDARLTPLASLASAITPVLGGTIGSGDRRVEVPAGAIATTTPFTLTPVGQQGLQAPLPPGWSPVVAADLRPAGVSFSAPAILRVAVPPAVAAGTSLTLASWDAEARGWRAVAIASVPAGGADLEGPLAGSGQFAWILADQQPSVPAAPIVGEFIAGVPVPDVPQEATTTITPQPRIIFYEPGVHAAVTGALTSPSALPSGTRLWSRITESYRFRNGSETYPDPTIQDLTFYQTTADGQHLSASSVASPSRTFEPLSLESGVIGVELYVPPTAGAAPAMIASAGGFVETSTGERLEFPLGTVASPVAAALTRLAAGEIGIPVPAPLVFIGAVDVSLTGGTVSGPGVLSIAKPVDLPADAQVLVAKLVTLRDRTRFVLVALARIDGDRLVSEAMLPRNRVEMDGVRASGRYVFVSTTQPVGFFSGRVIDGGGQPFGGAQVSADPFPIVGRSRQGSASYVAPAAVGDVSLAALDVVTSDRGVTSAALNAARDELAVDLRLVAEPPRVTSITPANAARNVPLASAVIVTFSESIDPATVSGTNAANAVLLDPAGEPVVAALTLAGGNTLLTVRPAVALQPNTSYTFRLAAAVADVSGQTLGAPVTVAFTSLDTSAPLPPSAGLLSASIPEGGSTTVRATQGIAGLHDTVSIENITRGTSTPVLLDPNGGFLVLVQASLGDVLKLRILDEAGNETIADVPGFTRENPDGSISGVVGSGGGRVEGPNGTAVQVPEGALPDGTIVTLKSILETEFPVALEEAQKAYFPYSGGVQVDFGGATPARYVNVSVPAQPQDRPGDQWVVAQVIDVGGQQVLTAVDTAKLIDGRVQTSSPPCPGVLATGVYGLYKSVQPVGLAWGRMYQNGSYDGLRMSIQVPPTLAGIAMPFPVYSWENPLPICLPMITSRVTVGANTIRLRVRPEALTPADREIIVRNTTTGRDSHFRRDLLEYAFEVTGSQRDEYQAFVITAGGTQVPVAAIDVKAGPPGRAIVTLDADSIHVDVVEVLIRHLTPNPDAEYRFPRTEAEFEIQVGGGLGDSYEITALDADHVSRVVDMGLVDRFPSPYGPGNLLAKALPGTIDPTLAEILDYNAQHPDEPLPTGKYRVRVDLSTIHTTPDGPDPDNLPDVTTSTQQIPAAGIVNGGFAYAFDGQDTAEYEFAIEVRYNTGESEYVRIPRIRFVVTNAQTGRVIRSYEVQAPPRDEPYSVGVVTNDVQPPLMTGSPTRLNSFDPAAPLTFTFSEAMNADSIRTGAIVEWVRSGGSRQVVSGSWRIYGQNRIATFVPNAPLRLGEEYSITFIGRDALGGTLSPGTAPVTDYGGNSIATMRMPLKTFAPRLVSQLEFGRNGRPLEEIKDLEIRRKTVAGQQKTYLFGTTNAWVGAGYYTPIPPARFVAIDVTDADHPVETGFAFGGQIQKGLTFVPDIGVNGNPPMQFREPIGGTPPPCGPSGSSFTGDMAISAAYNLDFSMVQAWDVRNPDTPCLMSSKLLTANPDTLNSYTTRGTVHAVGWAESVGALRHTTGVAAYVAVRNVGLMVSDIGQNIPERLPGDRVREAYAPGDPWDVVAVRDRLITVDNTEKTLDIWDPNLAKVATTALPKKPRDIAVAEQFGVDENGDGIIRPSEVRDLAFVAAGECVGAVCSHAIYIVDLKGLQRPEEIGHINMPASVFKLDIDPQKKRLFATGYYSQADNRAALFMIDISDPTAFAADHDGDGLDDRIIWRHGFDAPTSWVNAPRIDKERGLAYIPTAGAVASRYGPLQIWAIYDNCCDLGVDFTAEAKDPPTGDRDALLRKEKEALQTGIRQGLQQAQTACGLNPSTISILEQGSGACLWRGRCDDNYQPGLSDHDYEVFVPDADFDTPVAGETLAACTVRELNNVFRDPKTGDSKEIAVPTGGKMRFDDITFFPEVRERFETARFDVEPPTSGGSDAIGDMGLGRRSLLLKWLLEGAYVTGVPGYNVAGRSLDSILEDLKTVTRIPRLEGFEWAMLQDYALAKSRAYVRIKGAADPGSAFHKLFVKQLHDAGKAGIRTTMARIVADPVGNTTVLDITRQRYDTNACIDVDPAITNPGSWRTKPCSSFEEYVASVAARMLREGRTLFTQDQVVNQAHRFFRVKSDRERIISEARADQFIALVSRFIEQAKVSTKPVYDAALPTDPDVTLRTGNMTVANTELARALARTKIPLTPRVFNQGFRNGTGLLVKMFTTDAEGSGAEVTSARIDLAGGEQRYLAFQRNPDGTLALDNGKAKPIFTLDVDMAAAGTGPHGVSFLVDIPDRSMKEANRENNLGGFFYYVLDRNTGTAPALPAQLFFPLAGRIDLLAPSPECFDSPTLQVTQRLMIGSELIGDQAILGRGEAVTITLSVTNYSGQTVTGALACSNITNQCYQIAGPIAPGGTGSVTINYVTPNEDRYIDGTPSLFSPQTGVQTGAATRLIVNGSAYAIQPLMDEEVVRAIDADLLNVEAGGTVHRHYRVVGKRSGLPKPNLTVTGELQGFFGSSVGTRAFTFKTNSYGEICVPTSGGACTTDQRSIDIPYDSTMVTSTSYTMTLRQVDGVDIPIENRTAFTFDVKDRGWSQNSSVGSTMGGGVKIVAGPGMEVEDGFELAKSGNFFTGPKSLDLSLSRQVTFKAKVEGDIGLTIKTPLIAAKAEAKAGVSGSTLLSWTDSFTFPYVPNASPLPGAPPFILEFQSHCAIADLTMSFLSNRNPLISRLANQLRESPCGDPQNFTKSHGFKVGASASASGGVDVGLQSPILGRIGNTRPTIGLTAGASASGSLSVEYETAYQRSATIPNEIEVTGSTMKVGLFGQVEYNAAFGLSLSDTFRVKKPGVTPTPEDTRQDSFSMKAIEKALKISTSSAEGGAFGLELEQDREGNPAGMTISFAQPKSFGWNAEGPGGNLGLGFGTSASFTLKRAEDMVTAIDRLANIQQLAGTLLRDRSHAGQLTMTPTKLNEEVGFFRTLLFDTVSTYKISETEGNGFELPLGFEGKLKGIGFNIGYAFKGDTKKTFTPEKGVNYKGRLLPLQTYRRNDGYQPALDLGLTGLIGQVWESVEASFGPANSYVSATIPTSGPTVLRSPNTAIMTIDGAAEAEPFEANLYSYRFTPVAGPVAEKPYRPADTAGPAGAPHFGVGGFHHFMPNNRQLAAPASLVIDYHDEDVVGLDESTFAIYGWNDDRADWDYIGGAVDPVANTVTTSVDRFRAYTVAPAMPGGTVALTHADNGATGSGEEAARRFTVTSGPLVMNNGQPVPDGTLFTVRSVAADGTDPADYGTVLATDQDASRERVQVRVTGGQLQFQVEYPSPNGVYVPGRVIVYSTTGTAYGALVLTRPVTP